MVISAIHTRLDTIQPSTGAPRDLLPARVPQPYSCHAHTHWTSHAAQLSRSQWQIEERLNNRATPTLWTPPACCLLAPKESGYPLICVDMIIYNAISLIKKGRLARENWTFTRPDPGGPPSLVDLLDSKILCLNFWIGYHRPWNRVYNRKPLKNGHQVVAK